MKIIATTIATILLCCSFQTFKMESGDTEHISTPSVVYYFPKQDPELKKWLKNN